MPVGAIPIQAPLSDTCPQPDTRLTETVDTALLPCVIVRLFGDAFIEKLTSATNTVTFHDDDQLLSLLLLSTARTCQ